MFLRSWFQGEDIDQPFDEPFMSATGFDQPSDIALLWDRVRADERVIHNFLQRVTDDSNVIARLVDHDRLHTRQIMWLKRAVDGTRTCPWIASRCCPTGLLMLQPCVQT